MDRRLIRYYDRELRHLQTVATEFAREFPKIAGRLGIEDFPCVDPYVERLLEGFAFLAARVQLKIDSEFPRFTQNLLETAYPHYLAPTPSMAVVQINPDLTEPGLAEGPVIERDAVMRSLLGKGEVTPCEYRSSHAVRLWPVRIAEARYYTRDLPLLELSEVPEAPAGVKAALRIHIDATAGLPFNKTKLDALTFFIDGADQTPFRIYEALIGHAKGVVVRPNLPKGVRAGKFHRFIDASEIRRVGYSMKEALLPYDSRSFQGYRLLHEYFAFPQRFLFVEIGGLRPAVEACGHGSLDIIVLLDQESIDLEGAVTKDNFRLNCTPALNLFPKRADRIFVSDRQSEFQVIPDRTRPLDFEVYRVTRVTGIDTDTGEEREFRPFYAASDSDEGGAGGGAYYSINRVPRAMSEAEVRHGKRSSYAGSEVYVSLVDANAAPYGQNLKQLSVETFCSNRDLPLQMSVGKGRTDFQLERGGSIESVRIVAGPTAPRASHAEGEMSWRLISHLSLNYLSIIDNDEQKGAAALRDLLKLYADYGDPTIRKQIDGVRGISSAPITRRVPTPGPITFARGLEVAVVMDEIGFEGTGIFLLGSVLEQFFSRYAGLNSFVETAVRSTDQGEVMRWPARVGQRPIF